MMTQLEMATSFAIFAAKQEAVAEVTPDHLLAGSLQTIARFGIASLGPWNIDLEAIGIDWLRQPEGPRPKVAYSQGAVDVLDRAARIARSNGDSSVGVNHLLAAFAAEEDGLMAELKQAHGITSATWRVAVAGLAPETAPPAAPPPSAGEPKVLREYLTPEEAAESLGVHVQTMRAYVRSERLPAFRLAGERSIRILRTDLNKVLEPLKAEK